MIEMSRTPVVFVAVGWVGGRRGAGVVVQQPGFGGDTCLDYMLKVPLLIAVDVGFGVLVAGTSDQRGYVDDESA